MAKEDVVKVEGVVKELLPGTQFKVRLNEFDHDIIAHLSGKMRQNKINVLLGDVVEVEMSPYDTTKGRIVFRQK